MMRSVTGCKEQMILTVGDPRLDGAGWLKIFIMLLRTARNLKLTDCLFLGYFHVIFLDHSISGSALNLL